MTTRINATGSCLCGKVRLSTTSLSPNLGACHCSMCRKWVAGPYLSVDCGNDLKIEGKEFVGVFESSDWGNRNFCKNCGSSLFYYLKPKGQYFVSSEVFDLKELNFDHQIFVDEKPAYYDFANKTHNMTGAEVFAQATQE